MRNILFFRLLFKVFSIVLIFFLCRFQANGQNKRAVFLGLQPAITVEPDYEKNEFDINVLPIVFQVSLSKRIDFRLVSIFNYHFSPDKNEFSDLGIEAGLPVFFKAKEELSNPSSGFFISPAFLFVRNIENDHYSITCAVEPGYFFSFDSRFAFSLQLQLGGTYFMYDEEIPNAWKSHFGFKGNLGFWINKRNNN